MNRTVVVAWALCTASAASAQDSGVTVSVGARTWFTEWTTFSYIQDQNGNNTALTQVSADNKLVLVPIVSARWGDFLGSLSVFPSTAYSFSDGISGKRHEYDINAGYSLMPGLTLTLGYKKVSQLRGDHLYEPAGLVIGMNANAPVAGALSLYGGLGLARLKTPTSDNKFIVQFKADYRLTEVGLAYSLLPDAVAGRWTLTAGYRIQVMGSKEAFDQNGRPQDGRDTTQGLTFGAIASF